MKSRPARAAALSAYVLHRWDWSESSLILDLFTREAGRVAVVAKGAKRPYSQFRPVLLPFQRLTVSLSRATDDDQVQSLRGAEWAGGLPLVGGEALLSGFYLNELLMQLLARGDAHPALFDAYHDTLQPLADPARAPAALRAFELRLLKAIGLLPDLACLTATQAPLVPARGARLDAEAGLVDEPRDAQAVPGAVWLALDGALQTGRDTDALRAVCALAPPALRTQLRDALHYHLGRGELRTRGVMRDARRVLGAPAVESKGSR